MEARILRPLLWFGLVKYRSEKIPVRGAALLSQGGDVRPASHFRYNDRNAICDPALMQFEQKFRSHKNCRSFEFVGAGRRRFPARETDSEALRSAKKLRSNRRHGLHQDG
jgi:hypothetical protein